MEYNKKTAIKLIVGSIIISTVPHGGEPSDGGCGCFDVHSFCVADPFHREIHHAEQRYYTDFPLRIPTITDSSATTIIIKNLKFSF